MYLDEYKRWMAAELEDADLKPELAKIEGNDDEIKDRFAVALKFGTAGLRGRSGRWHQPYEYLCCASGHAGVWQTRSRLRAGSQTVAIGPTTAA